MWFTLLANRRRIWDEPIQNFGFVIDGESLAYTLKDHKQLLSEVSSHCSTVVCCRMSPIQKSEVITVTKNARDRYFLWRTANFSFLTLHRSSKS